LPEKYHDHLSTGHHTQVTGGSKGIGKHIAIEAVKLGANVSIMARNIDVLEEAKNEIIKQIIFPNDQQVICIPVDVSGPFETIQQAVNKAESRLGPVSVLVNNAGYCRAAKMEDTPVELFKVKILISASFFFNL
jgi:NAD(P)-dependent dehydrogenase (short-subunit alcohol dehydrogenase family)